MSFDIDRLSFLRSVFGSPPLRRASDVARQLEELEARYTRWQAILDAHFGDSYPFDISMVRPVANGAVLLFRVATPEHCSSRVAYVVSGEVKWDVVLDTATNTP